MTYTTWILIGIGLLVGSFVLTLGICLLFDPEDDQYYLNDHLGEINEDDKLYIRRIMSRRGR